MYEAREQNKHLDVGGGGGMWNIRKQLYNCDSGSLDAEPPLSFFEGEI